MYGFEDYTVGYIYVVYMQGVVSRFIALEDISSSN